jgi:hypothetical protein
MSTPEIQHASYVSADQLLDHHVGIWDDCPFTVTKSEGLAANHAQVLSLVDFKTFRDWVNETLEGWEGEGVDVSDLRGKFQKACAGFASENIYVNLDSECLLDR